MTKDLTVTVALPSPGRDAAVLHVAAQYEPEVLRIVAGIPMTDFRGSLASHRFLKCRDRTLQRLDEAAALARTMVGPRTAIETDLIRGSLADYLASGVDPANVLVVPSRSSGRSPVRQTTTRDGRVPVAVPEREPVMS